MALMKPPRPNYGTARLPVYKEKAPKAPIRKALQARERQALLAACKGYTNREIATEMGTTLQVAKNLLRSAYIKIGVNDGACSRVKALLFVIRNGWFNPLSDGD
jgi:DNA-binding NarL/FixJ family response regulator